MRAPHVEINRYGVVALVMCSSLSYPGLHCAFSMPFCLCMALSLQGKSLTISANFAMHHAYVEVNPRIRPPLPPMSSAMWVYTFLQP